MVMPDQLLVGAVGVAIILVMSRLVFMAHRACTRGPDAGLDKPPDQATNPDDDEGDLNLPDAEAESASALIAKHIAEWH